MAAKVASPLGFWHKHGMGGSRIARRAALPWLLAFAPAQGLTQLVAEAEALGARTGVAAMELSGTWRHRHRDRERFVPASNMKLCTAAAVLAGLGADYEFRTAFALRGGRLRARAGGDPNWIVGTATAPEFLFRALVAALQRRGVDSISGIDLDSHSFTGPSRPRGWPQDQLDAAYCAPTGGFALEQGTFRLRLQPGAGAAEAALVAPFVQVPIEGRIQIVKDSKGAVYGALDTGLAVRLQGRMWHKQGTVELRAAVRDPEAWFRRALEQALLAGGIRVRPAAAPPDAEDLLVHRTPLRAALQRMLQDSSNFDAEQCARVLGMERAGDGSLEGAVAAMRSALAQLLGAEPAGFEPADGSGLSRGNSLTPQLLVQVLRAAAATPFGDLYFAALPVAGESGTLADRFRRSPVRGRVHAKTGWIRGVSALSGQLVRRDGSRCLFAIVMNYDPDASGQNQRLKDLQERMVEALDAMGTSSG
jgi:D-alanyl-D-alanine carboxypeptidase/D-alanyl-D-alanine-endopeptidase (penicillin-binding protein 4)